MFKKILLVLLVFASTFALVACNKKPDEDVNETKTLLLQASEMDGVFNPFFYSSAYDGDVIGLVNVGLLTLDKKAAVVAGNEYPTLGLDYSIYYTNNLETFAKKETYAENDYVVYDIVLKNGAKFSDGTVMSADDVLFNMYTYLDPAYVGSSTLYTLPILGLADYRTQVVNSNQYGLVADAILADGGRGAAYQETSKYTKEQFDFYWSEIDKAGLKFSQEIVDYVAKGYGTQAHANSYAVGLNIEDILGSEGMKTAWGMRLWGFGGFQIDYTEDAAGNVVDAYPAFNPESAAHTKLPRLKEVYTEAADGYYVIVENKYVAFSATNDAHKNLKRYNFTAYEEDAEGGFVKYGKAVFNDANPKHKVLTTKYKAAFKSFTTVTGEVYTSENIGELNAKVYFETIVEAYENDYQTASSTESAGIDFVGVAKEVFIASYAKVGSVPNISGLQKTTTKVNGVDHEVVRVVLTRQNPKAILSLGVTVAPKHYYTVGYEYQKDSIRNYGVEYKSKAFMDHLATFNSAPLGAGPYKYVSRDSGDGTVYLERNVNFHTLGGDNIQNAIIKKVAFKIIESGSEFSALEAKSVHYATVSASADVMEDIGDSKNIVPVLVDNLGYGYIVINPEVYDNLDERIAIQSLFNLAKVYEYYPSGLADVIYRSQSQVSWAYPEGAKAIYEYDATMATAITHFKKAGYAFNETTKKFTGVPKVVMTIPSEASAHPAGGIFLAAKDLLDQLGIENEIKVDANLTANIKKGPVGIYALAWQAAADPDMYQVYHHESQAESVTSNGIKWLYGNGTSNDLGTITVKKLNGQEVEMNQTEALHYIGELIEEGVKYMLAEERKPIYEKALEVLAQLAIEVPTYQRKNLFAFDGKVIDATSLSQEVTPYWGPMAEIWKVKFVKKK